jgi:hypothetical protein
LGSIDASLGHQLHLVVEGPRFLGTIFSLSVTRG